MSALLYVLYVGIFITIFGNQIGEGFLLELMQLTERTISFQLLSGPDWQKIAEESLLSTKLLVSCVWRPPKFRKSWFISGACGNDTPSLPLCTKILNDHWGGKWTELNFRLLTRSYLTSFRLSLLSKEGISIEFLKEFLLCHDFYCVKMFTETN